MGFPVSEAEHMPDIAADAYALALRRFQAGLSDRRPRWRAHPARSLYAKPYVLFYTTKRVGGGVQNFEAIKLMKFGVS